MTEAAIEPSALILMIEARALVAEYTRSARAAERIILRGLAGHHIRWVYAEFEMAWRPTDPPTRWPTQPLLDTDTKWFWYVGPGVTWTVDWDVSDAHRVGPMRPSPASPPPPAETEWEILNCTATLVRVVRADVMRQLYVLGLAKPEPAQEPATEPAQETASKSAEPPKSKMGWLKWASERKQWRKRPGETVEDYGVRLHPHMVAAHSRDEVMGVWKPGTIGRRLYDLK